jgi:hypothetical protein
MQIRARERARRQAGRFGGAIREDGSVLWVRRGDSSLRGGFYALPRRWGRPQDSGVTRTEKRWAPRGALSRRGRRDFVPGVGAGGARRAEDSGGGRCRGTLAPARPGREGGLVRPSSRAMARASTPRFSPRALGDPPALPIRFDARFYLVDLPPGESRGSPASRRRRVDPAGGSAAPVGRGSALLIRRPGTLGPGRARGRGGLPLLTDRTRRPGRPIRGARGGAHRVPARAAARAGRTPTLPRHARNCLLSATRSWGGGPRLSLAEERPSWASWIAGRGGQGRPAHASPSRSHRRRAQALGCPSRPRARPRRWTP